jgi:hypothetical protein
MVDGVGVGVMGEKGDGRREKKADRSVITDQVSFGAMIEDVKFYCKGIRLG